MKKRLTNFLEKSKHFSPYQSGFRGKKETLEQLARLEMQVRNAQNKGNVVCAVFLDLKKAFDTSQRHLILKNLNEYNVEGNLYNYCLNFLTDRKFDVKVGNAISEESEQIHGIPQGSVLSPILFLISINNIGKSLEKETNIGQFADDTGIARTFQPTNGFTSNKEEKMSSETNKLVKDIEDLGYTVNKPKTQGILFNSKNEWEIKVGDAKITTQKEVKNLGVTFDKHLKFKTHIQNRRKSAKSIINVIKIVKNKGGFKKKPHGLRTIYKGLLASTLYYGTEVMHDCDKVEMKKSDALMNEARRISTNALKGTRIEAVNAFLGEFPPEMERENARLNFWARKTTSKDNIAGQMLNDSKNTAKRSKKYGTVGLARNIRSKLNELQIKESDTNKTEAFSNQIDWPEINIDTELSKIFSKKEDSPEFMKRETISHIRTRYDEHVEIYTDGSKCENPQAKELDEDNVMREDHLVGAGVYAKDPNINLELRITNNTAIATAEMIGIEYALREINDKLRSSDDNAIKTKKKCVILTDSLSALQAIETDEYTNSRYDIISRIRETHNEIHKLGVDVSLAWIPSHTDIEGNEAADRLAKLATAHRTVDIDCKLGNTELKALIKQRRKIIYDREWKKSDCFTRRLIPTIKHPKIPMGGKYEKRTRLILNNPIWKAKNRKNNKCECGNTEKTVEHVLIHCTRHDVDRGIIRRQYQNHDLQLTIENILSTNQKSNITDINLKYINNLKELI